MCNVNWYSEHVTLQSLTTDTSVIKEFSSCVGSQYDIEDFLSDDFGKRGAFHSSFYLLCKSYFYKRVDIIVTISNKTFNMKLNIHINMFL